MLQRIPAVYGAAWFTLFAVVGLNACSKEDYPRVSIGPGVEHRFVIYFREGVTADEVRQFNEDYLYVMRADGRGLESRIKHSDFLRLSPRQANEHWAIAISFPASTTDDEIQSAKEKIASSPIVLKIFENVAPNQIKPDDLPVDR